MNVHVHISACATNSQGEDGGGCSKFRASKDSWQVNVINKGPLRPFLNCAALNEMFFKTSPCPVSLLAQMGHHSPALTLVRQVG
jgi:hypothetical protein